MRTDSSPRRLLVVGSCNLDLQLQVEHLPFGGETQLASGFRRSAGGKGANQAAAAAKLGARVSMLGALGNDDAGTLLESALRCSGVDTSLLTRVDQPTGTAAILLTPGGQNSIIVAPGANHGLAPQHIRALAARFAEAALVLTQLETTLAVLNETLALAEAAQVPVMLDPAPPAALPTEALARITWFTPNAHEAAFYLACDADEPERDPQATARRLQQLGPRNILLKLGAAGACLLSEAGEWHFAAAPRVRVVDTTGAGDVTNAAFAVALLRGLSNAEALGYAVAAASFSVSRPGALPGSPTQQELEDFLRSTGAPR